MFLLAESLSDSGQYPEKEYMVLLHCSCSMRLTMALNSSWAVTPFPTHQPPLQAGCFYPADMAVMDPLGETMGHLPCLTRFYFLLIEIVEYRLQEDLDLSTKMADHADNKEFYYLAQGKVHALLLFLMMPFPGPGTGDRRD